MSPSVVLLACAQNMIMGSVEVIRFGRVKVRLEGGNRKVMMRLR